MNATATRTPPSGIAGAVIVLDLRGDKDGRYAVPSSIARARIRAQLDGLGPGSFIQLRVNRWTLLSDAAGLIPAGARVQIHADDHQTAQQWVRDLELSPT